MSLSMSRQERAFMQLQAGGVRVIPNSSGTATVGNGDAVRHIKLAMQNTPALLRRRDKTGTRSTTVGVVGRTGASWSFESSLVSGVIPPDLDPLLQSIFGADPGPAESRR